MKGRSWISATFLLMQAATSQAAETNTMRPRLELREDVRLEITQLKRLDSEKVVELKFKVVNGTDRATTLKDLGIAFGHQLGQIALIDFDARKKYGIGHAGSCLCSSFPERDGGTVPAHGEREFWAWFRPADQAALAVEFPGFPPMLGVRVQ
jgi:hypothetical protein